MMKQVLSVTIKFTDGSSRSVFVEQGEGFYKEEHLERLSVTDHTVYIVNGRVRDTPKLELEL